MLGAIPRPPPPASLSFLLTPCNCNKLFLFLDQFQLHKREGSNCRGVIIFLQSPPIGGHHSMTIILANSKKTIMIFSPPSTDVPNSSWAPNHCNHVLVLVSHLLVLVFHVLVLVFHVLVLRLKLHKKIIRGPVGELQSGGRLQLARHPRIAGQPFSPPEPN